MGHLPTTIRTHQQAYSFWGFPGGAAGGTAILSGGTADTKGSWVEVTSSLAQDCAGILLQLRDDNTGNYLIDIGVGGAGSEEVVLANLLHHAQTGAQGESVLIPLALPGGSRVAMRVQSNGTTDDVQVQVFLFPRALEAFPGFSRSVTLGADTSDSGGTQIDPGGTADTKGSYTQIVASTSAEINALMMALGNTGNTALSLTEINLDIAIGSAGSEEILIADYYAGASGTSDVYMPKFSTVFPLNIPAGSRLAARAASDITNASDRLFDLILYGFA